jgi:hypothetical protein
MAGADRQNETAMPAMIDSVDHFIGTSDWTLYARIGSLLTN